MLSTPDLNYLRGPNHQATLYLSVFIPEIVYLGEVNGAHARGANQITVSDVSGNIADVEAGMTIHVGTLEGDYDVSRRRLRSRSGQVLTVDENPVEWEDGQFITVYRNWEFWPVFPFIEDSEPYTFYKDKDIAYSDQNEEPTPVALMGGNRAFFYNGNPLVVALSATNSYAIASGATISSYAWATTGGTLSAPTSSTTNITFNAPGTYIIKLTVTDSNGKTQSTRRVYFVHTRDGDDQPYRDFNVQYIRGNWQSGGYSTSILVNGDASVDEFPDRALVLIWSEQFFNGTEHYIDNSTNVLFSGYVVRDTSTVDGLFNTDNVTFEAFTIDELMRRHENFNVSLSDHPSPTKWYQYKNLSIGRALHHLWKWHSTLFDICDVFIESESITDYLMYACDDFTNGTLYAMADSFLFSNSNHSRVVSRKDGIIIVERDVNYLSDADRDNVTTQMVLADIDRKPNTLSLDRQHFRGVSFVMLTGTTYDGSTFTPIIAKSPGEVPNTDGNRSLQMERQVFLSQQDANERVGRVHAVQDAIFRGLPVPFHGNYSFIDLVPQQWHKINIAPTDTLRGYDLQPLRLLSRTINMTYNSQAGILDVSVDYEPDATGNDGIAGRFPTELPDEIPPPEPPSEPNGVAPGIVATFDSTNGCHVLGSWLTRNGNLGGTRIHDLWGHIDPWWQVKQNSTNATKAIMFKCGAGYIHRTANRGMSWVNVTPISTPPPNDAGDSPAPASNQLTYVQYEGNLFQRNGHAFLANWNNGSENRSWILYTEDDCSSWQWVSLFSSEGGIVPGPGTPSTGTTYVKFGGSSAPYANDGVAALTASKFIAIWTGLAGADASKMWAVVGTVDNDNNITLGSFVQYTGNTDIGYAQIVALDTTHALIVYRDYVADEFKTVVVTVSGTTPTFSSTSDVVLAIGDIAGLANFTSTTWSIAGITSAQVLMAVATGLSGVDGIWCSRLIISGESVASEGWDGADTTNEYDQVRIGIVSTTAAVLVGSRINGGSIFSISDKRTCHSIRASLGDPITYGTPVVIYSSDTNLYNYSPDITIVDGKACCTYVADITPGVGDNLDFHLVVGTIGGSSVTWGTFVTVHTAGVDCPTVEPINTNEIGVFYPSGSTLNAKRYSLSGTTPTLEDTWTQTGVGASFSVSKFVGADNVIVQAYSEYLLGIGTGGGGGGSGSPYDNEGISISISGEDGLSLYVTFFNQTDEVLYLRVYDLPLLEAVFVDPVSISECTPTQYNDKEYIAYVACFRDSYTHIVVVGRFNYSGTKHVIESVDGGQTFSSVISDWGTDHASAVFISIYDVPFVIRDNGTVGTLYSGLSLVQRLSFAFRVRHGSLCAKKNGLHVLVGGIEDASGVIVGYSSSPFTTFNNITQNHPVNGSITSTVFLK